MWAGTSLKDMAADCDSEWEDFSGKGTILTLEKAQAAERRGLAKMASLAAVCVAWTPYGLEHLCRAIRRQLKSADSESFEAGQAARVEVLRKGGERVLLASLWPWVGSGSGAVTAACRALETLVADTLSARVLVQAGAIGPVLAALRRTGANQDMLTAASTVVERLTGTDEAKAIAVSEGAFEVLVDLLRETRVPARALVAACSALESLAAALEGVSRQSRGQAIESMVSLIRRQGALADDRGVRAACSALKSLAGYPEGRVIAGRAGGVEAVVEVIVRQKAVEKTQTAACQALLVLAVDRGCRTVAGRVGGVEAVARIAGSPLVMEDSLVAAAFAVLALLAADENIRCVMKRVGALAVLVEVLQRPGRSERMLAEAFRAVRSVAKLYGDGECCNGSEGAIALQDAWGRLVEETTASLRASDRATAEVKRAACEALEALTRTEWAGRLAVWAGGIGAVIAVMLAEGTPMEEGLSALWNMATREAGGRAELLRADGVQELVNKVCRPEASLEALLHAGPILWEILTDDGDGVAPSEQGKAQERILARIVKAIHPDLEEAPLIRACDAVLRMVGPGSCPAAVRAGGMEAAVMVVKRRGTPDATLAVACELVRRMAGSCIKGREEAERLGAAAEMDRILAWSCASEELLHAAKAALESIAGPEAERWTDAEDGASEELAGGRLLRRRVGAA